MTTNPELIAKALDGRHWRYDSPPDVVRDLVAALEQSEQELADAPAEIERLDEFQNELAQMMPEEFDGEEAQEAIIMRWIIEGLMPWKPRAEAAEAKLAEQAGVTEAEWRKAIADQVRRNCTPSSDAYDKGGDPLIYAVADWIENPPEWSHFVVPAARWQRDVQAEALEAAADEFWARLPDGSSNGRVYNSYRIGAMLRVRAAELRKPQTEETKP